MTDADEARSFRNALGSFATGVTIVTTHSDDGRDVGLTANSFNSVSLDPPMVLWSLAKTSASLPAFTEAPGFAVHILAADQEALSNRFASKGADKFSDLEFRRNDAGVPLLNDCTALFQCRTAYRYEGGDHVIFVGEVVAFEHLDKPPLVFHGGRYAEARSKVAATAGQSFDGELGQAGLGHLVTRAYMQLVAPLRRQAEKLGLSAPERYMMNVLMSDAAHSLQEINDIISHTGIAVTPETAAELIKRGLVFNEMPGSAASGSAEAQFRLTDDGRRLAIELLAAAKMLEADALTSLTEEEQRILAHLLTRFVADLGTKTDNRAARHLDLLQIAVGRATDDH